MARATFSAHETPDRRDIRYPSHPGNDLIAGQRSLEPQAYLRSNPRPGFPGYTDSGIRESVAATRIEKFRDAGALSVRLIESQRLAGHNRRRSL